MLSKSPPDRFRTQQQMVLVLCVSCRGGAVAVQKAPVDTEWVASSQQALNAACVLHLIEHIYSTQMLL